MKWLQVKRRAPGVGALRLIFYWSFVKNGLLVIGLVLYRLRRFGAEHVPSRGPIVYVSNHQSHFDPVIVGELIADRPFAALARDSLFRVPLLGILIRSLRAIPVRRGKADMRAMRAMLRELEAGRCVLLFPEGTRTPDGTVQRFRPGVLLLLKRTDAVVVPVAIEGAHEVWPKTRRLPRLWGRIAVRAGAPLRPEDRAGLDETALLERLRDQIEQMRQELRAGMKGRGRPRDLTACSAGPGSGAPSADGSRTSR